ncbi:GNAT family N-acetyltransferase [Flavobacterium sp. SM15]|uniref:GNAT family N-acetyltransferase n=1 Tax=Flavobacterium sp. SM15 TaxID=2908005 RepID=UPI001ED9ECF4|nr:GNAT family N-acetyltransferase [Flavobacterium sp. SM15]MCG2611010.1 GNAT family N-acetyltransferase [Flavobacterium sp. SM15]
MKNYTVRKYQKSDYALWNEFIAQSKNATFLFHRDFMEYHSDRFEDFSLLVFESEKLIACLAANKKENEIFSHQGLSYGGVLVKKDIRIKEYTLVFKAILKFMSDHQLNQFSLKMLPKIYHKTISEEIDYVAFLAGADVVRSDVYLVIDNSEKYKPNRNRKRALTLAENLNIEIKQDKNYDDFWNQILTPNLVNRFGVQPVHSLEEIKKLAVLFPEKIVLFNAYQDGNLKAGVVMFLTDTVAHFQYSSGSEDRNDTAALDVLFDFIIRKYSDKKYVSFGSSSENDGRKLNEGLAYWKESFGARTSVQNFIKFQTAAYTALDI